jgi:hypothetical protein
MNLFRSLAVASTSAVLLMAKWLLHSHTSR